jgi:outer membrane biosynthesis protein TonB
MERRDPFSVAQRVLMRCGFPLSALVHTAFLLWLLISPSAKPFAASAIDSVPVDLISTSEFTQMMAGSKEAPKAEAPKPMVDKIAEPTPAKDSTPKVSDKKEIAAATEEKPVTKPTPPEPKPEANKKPEPKTDPIADEI